MKKAANAQKTDEVRTEYDFSKGVRGKYAKRFAAGSNVVVIDPDIAKVFPDSDAVNEALRTLVRVAGKTAKLPVPAKKRGKA